MERAFFGRLSALNLSRKIIIVLSVYFVILWISFNHMGYRISNIARLVSLGTYIDINHILTGSLAKLGLKETTRRFEVAAIVNDICNCRVESQRPWIYMEDFAGRLGKYTVAGLPARLASGFSGDHQQDHQCLWFPSCYNVTRVFFIVCILLGLKLLTKKILTAQFS